MNEFEMYSFAKQIAFWKNVIREFPFDYNIIRDYSFLVEIA